MKKMGKIVYLFLIISLLLIGAVYAENLNLKINAAVNDYNADFYAKTSSLSNESFDVYDFKVPGNPSNYSNLYSVLGTGEHLSIDSWSASTNPRDLNLVYSVSEAQTGTLILSWTKQTGSYDGTLYDYGTDAGRTILVSSVDMRSASTYSASLSGDNIRYFKLSVEGYSTSTEETPEENHGGRVRVEKNFSIDKTIFKIMLKQNESFKTSFKITNTEEFAQDFFISASGDIKDFVLFSDKFITLKAKGEGVIDVTFFAYDDTQPDVYNGNLIVGTTYETQNIQVIFNVKCKSDLCGSLFSCLMDNLLLIILIFFLLILFFLIYFKILRDKLLWELIYQYKKEVKKQKDYLKKEKKRDYDKLKTSGERKELRKEFKVVKRKRLETLREIYKGKVKEFKKYKKISTREQLKKKVEELKNQGYNINILEDKFKIPTVEQIKSKIKLQEKKSHEIGVLKPLDFKLKILKNHSYLRIMEKEKDKEKKK